MARTSVIMRFDGLFREDVAAVRLRGLSEPTVQAAQRLAKLPPADTGADERPGNRPEIILIRRLLAIYFIVTSGGCGNHAQSFLDKQLAK